MTTYHQPSNVPKKAATWAVATSCEALYEHAQEIANSLSCEAVMCQKGEALPLCEGVLWLSPEGLSAHRAPQCSVTTRAARRSTPFNFKAGLRVDFLSPQFRYRLQHSGIRQLLAKAVGVHPRSHLKIVDATAGLGRDAFVLAHLGCEVHMIERSPIIGALLQDGLSRACLLDPIALKMQLTVADAHDVLKKLSEDQAPDVICLDPMYPTKRSGALVKQAMRTLRFVVGDDPDSSDLLEWALACAKQRVVVKRPRHADCLSDAKPDVVFQGQSSRFDVYWAWTKQGKKS